MKKRNRVGKEGRKVRRREGRKEERKEGMEWNERQKEGQKGV